MTQAGTEAHPANSFSILDGHQFLSLTTYRQNGEAVTTPVWFAQVDDQLYLMTMLASGKAKRIMNNKRVTIAPCDRMGTLLGPSMEAVAHVVSEDGLSAADAALAAKYGELKKGFDAQLTDPTHRAYLVITAN
ncbi:MAG: PPOX class F420-dependent oxidoreductase [Anaerolineae bacterium]|nr:PPOX class F420-dependent oxidoreductase [Anaerolineae bacterium]